ncbi:MAG: hypothetical protein K9M10_02465 [Candidatus Pacebacteria bacterium]|nr:hypothetical protein [Candidatus Paceibacterota bacterium]MCF7857319.1 hypothetical protein [Candidatus Paceibacterota bacterium]
MEQSSSQTEDSRNTTGGIRNAQMRFGDRARSHLTSERLRSARPSLRDGRESANGASRFRGTSSEEAPSPSRKGSFAKHLVERARMQKGGLAKPRKITSFSKWMGIGVACTSYTWQFIFGVLSLTPFVLVSIYEDFSTSTITGKVLNWFVDLSTPFPAQEIGILFWGVTSLIAIVTFLGFWIWYKFLGNDPFATGMSTGITLLVIALSLIPVTNLLPSLILWVVYMNFQSLFSSEQS